MENWEKAFHAEKSDFAPPPTWKIFLLHHWLVSSIQIFTEMRGSPRSKIAQLQSPRDHSFNPETRMKAVHIFYIRHSYVHWLVKRFLEKIELFHCKYNVYFVFCHTGNGSVQHVWFSQNVMLTVRIACVMHKLAIIVRLIYVLEKTYLWIEKTIYSLIKTIYSFEVVSAE